MTPKKIAKKIAKKTAALPKPERINVPYKATELYEVLQEIERNVTEAHNLVATSPNNSLWVTASFVDGLRCIVDDVVEYLAPHVAAVEQAWHDRPKQKTKQKKTRLK